MTDRRKGARVERLTAASAGETAELAALCMADNSYYAALYGNLRRDERLSLMRERMEATIAYCADGGGLFGVMDGEGLAAYEYMVDYGRLKEQAPRLFNYVFSCGDGGDAPHLREIERRLSCFLAEGRRVTYILGCGVAPRARGDISLLAAMAHFNKALLRSEEVIAADFSNRELLELCARRGRFEITALGRDYWFFLRR